MTHQKRLLPLVLGMSTLIFATSALADPRDYLFRDKRICVADGAFCFRGTLTYRSNPRLLRLRARIQFADGPGLLRIWVAGSNTLGHHRLAPVEVRVRGNHGEIIDHKMIPDYPDVEQWKVDRVEFFAAGAH